MLRWKIPFAICAIAISACPLTSFAQLVVEVARPEIAIPQQQAAAVNPMLQTYTKTSGVRTASFNRLAPLAPTQRHVERGESPEITIRTPFVHPQNPNLYLFVVENVGTVDATSATVDLYVPPNVTITNVIPSSASSNARLAHIRLTNLAAGTKSIIEVEISPTNDTVLFQTRIALESVHKFTTSASQNYVAWLKPNTIAPISPLAITANAARARTSKSTAAAGQASVDAKLLKTVNSLRAAGQNALADAYIAAVANSDTYGAETF